MKKFIIPFALIISLALASCSKSSDTVDPRDQMVGTYTGVGAWYLFGNGTSSFTSDERRKKNIEPARNGGRGRAQELWRQRLCTASL